jgi:hypothetical protein
MAGVQPNVMEMDMSAPDAIEARRHATIMDGATLLNKKRHVEDPKRQLSVRQ